MIFLFSKSEYFAERSSLVRLYLLDLELPRLLAPDLITCRSCGIQYVGQTKNKLLTRFQSHHFDIMHNNDTTVARHFNKCPPQNPGKFNGLEISILSFLRPPPSSRVSQELRDKEEKRWIHRLSSVVPRGLNLLD